MPQRVPIKLPFPARGIDASAPLDAMPPELCPFAVNFRTLSNIGRESGGVRPGWELWANAGPNYTNAGNDATVVNGTQLWLNNVPYYMAWLQPAVGTGAWAYSQLTASGNANWQVSTGGSGTLPSVWPLIGLTQAGGQVYVCGGGNHVIVNPSTWNRTAWTLSDGSFPTQANILATYNGRIWLARYGYQGWFCTRQLDFLDLDYGAAPVATSAQAGTTSPAGQVGDVITAFMPYADQYMVIGGKQSMWQMIGDPSQGGRIVPIQGSGGNISPRSWCLDDQSRLYWFDGMRIMRMDTPGTKPYAVVDRRMQGFVAFAAQTSLFYFAVQMAFDPQTKYVYLNLAISGGVARYIVLDTVTDSAWLEQLGGGNEIGFMDSVNTQFEASTGVLAVASVGSGNERAMRIDRQRAIDSVVSLNYAAELHYAPIAMDEGRMESMAHSLAMSVQGGSQDLFWHWHTGPSAEAVAAQANGNAVRRGAMFEQAVNSGERRDYSAAVRARGVWHQLRLIRDAPASPSPATNYRQLRLGDCHITLEPRSRVRRGFGSGGISDGSGGSL